MKKVVSCRVMGMNIERKLYEGVAVPTALYEGETWSMAVSEKKLNVMATRCMRSVQSNTHGPSEK